MRFRLVGADALLVEVDDPAGWFTELTRRREAGELAVTEIVPGARTVLLDGLADVTAATEAIRSWTPAGVDDQAAGDGADDGVDDGASDPAAMTVRIPVEFDGEDLPAVAKLWQTDFQGVVDRLRDTAFRVAFCGFSPGWAYLSGLPEELAVPRLETPRPRVPAGSVALAEAYAGIYPTASPGGWLLVGRTDVTLFDPDRSPPALLTPGTQVRFVERTDA